MLLEPFLTSSLNTAATYYRQFIVHLVSVQLLTFKVNTSHAGPRFPDGNYHRPASVLNIQPPRRLAASGHPSWPSIGPETLGVLFRLLPDQVFVFAPYTTINFSHSSFALVLVYSTCYVPQMQYLCNGWLTERY